MITGLYLLRKESNEKEVQKCLFMLLLQGELEPNNPNNPMSGWGKGRSENYMEGYGL